MAVTAQQIAELAGVSRGTVDRALHNRGRVNPEVTAKIHKIALELGYKPNLIGQALVRIQSGFQARVRFSSPPRRRRCRSCVQACCAPQRSLPPRAWNCSSREIRGLDTEMVLEHIEELVSQGVQGLAIAPNTRRRCASALMNCTNRAFRSSHSTRMHRAAGVLRSSVWTTTAPDRPPQACFG